MTILNQVFITKDGSPKQDWNKDENYHIITKTTDNTGKQRHLVYLSGIVYFDYGTLVNDWVHDTITIQFNGLRWFKPQQGVHPVVQVAPVVSLGAVSNIQTHETEVLGWGVNSVQTAMITSSDPSFDVIQLKCDLVVDGLDTHLERLTYFVAAIGDVAKQN